MTEPMRPRRPAILEPADAEAIRGEEDPALVAEAAALSAAATINACPLPTDISDDARELLDHAGDAGLSALAALWAQSPASTTPGTLWRLYLLHEWWQSAPERVGQATRSVGIDPSSVFVQLTSLFSAGAPSFPAVLRACAHLTEALSTLDQDALPPLPLLSIPALAQDLARASQLQSRGALE
ncbi:hypothetical protein ABYF34_01855 [Buchananella felis]|uniref:hypothetical protein n=1 Tax=Buchananella felis TaxID=3231492 RepID=UPI003526CCB6